MGHKEHKECSKPSANALLRTHLLQLALLRDALLSGVARKEFMGLKPPPKVLANLISRNQAATNMQGQEGRHKRALLL